MKSCSHAVDYTITNCTDNCKQCDVYLISYLIPSVALWPGSHLNHRSCQHQSYKLYNSTTLHIKTFNKEIHYACSGSELRAQTIASRTPQSNLLPHLTFTWGPSFAVDLGGHSDMEEFYRTLSDCTILISRTFSNGSKTRTQTLSLWRSLSLRLCLLACFIFIFSCKREIFCIISV